jgi:Na+/proline symporter
MTGTTVLAFLVIRSPEIGGIAGLQAKLPASAFEFFPSIGGDENTGLSHYAIGFGAFLAFAAVQWWSSWYPGQEPGGGGYVAQRMMSTKTEKGAVYATLLFQIAHYCLRPWPWILVGLAAMVLYPQLQGDELKMGYVYTMRDYLPVGLKGLLLASFLAAYLSTISTQLNWGAGYLANDLYGRFMADKETTQKNLVATSRFATILLMLIGLGATTLMDSISGVWLFIIECGAGLGLVLILRWYWWRINAWSEISATITPFIAYGVSRFILNLQFPESYFFTVGITTVVWILVTFLTQPESNATLSKFYAQVRPDGWWKPFAVNKGNSKSSMRWLVLCWLSAVILTYGILFLTGKIILSLWDEALVWAVVAAVGFIGLKQGMKQTSIWE